MDENKESVIGKRYGKTLSYLFTGGLEYLVEKLGGELQGISVRSTHGDALVIIRVEFEGKPMVGFAGSDTAASRSSAREHRTSPSPRKPRSRPS